MSAHISTERGRSPGFAGGISGSISSNCSRVRLLVYALVMAPTVLFVYQLQPNRVSFSTSVSVFHTASYNYVVDSRLTIICQAQGAGA